VPHPLVLVCVDFSPATDGVIETAVGIAGSSGGSLCLVHAAAPEPDFVGYDRPGGPYDRSVREGELTTERSQLADLAAGLSDRGIATTTALVKGPTVEVLLDEATDLGADLIVVGTHGHRALHRFLVGSTTDGLIRRSTIPVVVVPVHKE
jgi:nucleotide-binding universal stress UspA family protein